MKTIDKQDLDLLEHVPEEKANAIRTLREKECYSVVDRAAWYASLTPERQVEIQAWREAWLHAPETLQIPEKPSWIK